MKGGSLCTERRITEGLQATQARHGDIEHHHLGPTALDLLEDLPAVAGFTRDLDVVLGLEQASQPLANDTVVIGDDYGDHLTRVTPHRQSNQLQF
jgi:hypothetical protein